jgi:hypothetical protein
MVGFKLKKLLLSMLLALNFNLFAVEFDTVEDAVYYEFLCEKIPQRLVEPFYENTKYNKTIGCELLAIGQKESDWCVFVVLKTNENGTVDMGPLGLNSSHLGEYWYKNVITKKASEYRYDSDICYMIASIYYYRDLRNSMGTYTAYRQYNGGPTAERKLATKNYADDVSKFESKIVKDYENFKKENIERITLLFKEKSTYISKNSGQKSSDLM